MKSVVWTYNDNKKPIVYELDRYYFVKNQRQFDKLVDKLLDIDAVFSPADLSYPVILELESGFSITLKKVKEKDLEKSANKTMHLLNLVKNAKLK